MKRIVAPDGVEAAGERWQTGPLRVGSRCMTKMKTSAVLLSGMVVFAGGYLFAQGAEAGRISALRETLADDEFLRDERTCRRRRQSRRLGWR